VSSLVTPTRLAARPVLSTASTAGNQKRNTIFGAVLAQLAGRPVACLRQSAASRLPPVAPPIGASSGGVSSPAVPVLKAGEVEGRTTRERRLVTDDGGFDGRIDPLIGVLAPPMTPRAQGPASAAVSEHALPSFAELWGQLVRKIAWGRDGRRTTARIEIGTGDWGGAMPTVWRERLAKRLRERGLDLSESSAG
jgi:hypothetical protein